jgi:hypothetical protein
MKAYSGREKENLFLTLIKFSGRRRENNRKETLN